MGESREGGEKGGNNVYVCVGLNCGELGDSFLKQQLIRGVISHNPGQGNYDREKTWGREREREGKGQEG